jgi:hypothetical protein
MKHIRNIVKTLKDGWQTGMTPKDVCADAFQKEVARRHLESYQEPPATFRTSYMLKQFDRANWAGVDPALMLIYAKVVKNMEDLLIPVYCHTAYRSPELQQQLQASGYSQLRVGPHQVGAAIDIVHAHMHWNAPKEVWDYLGVAYKEAARSVGVKIEWGGDWSFYDPAHCQLADWRTRTLEPQTKVLNLTPKGAWQYAKNTS